jgi:hypothetical protein
VFPTPPALSVLAAFTALTALTAFTALTALTALTAFLSLCVRGTRLECSEKIPELAPLTNGDA